jgi:glutamate formiminotransferase
MNLLDHEVTGLITAFDAVATRAEAAGMRVVDSEIVGLAPAASVREDVVRHIRLTGFDPDGQILERLAQGTA